MLIENSKKSIRSRIKEKTAATLTCIVLAVLLPQLAHVAGALSGSGTAIGQTLLPMHLPIILAGLISGSTVGMISGFAAPIVSFALTSMPAAASLPFMCIELMSYGFFAGLISKKNIPSLFKIVSVQLLGRAVRFLSMLSYAAVLGKGASSAVAYLAGVHVGLVGIILQIAAFVICDVIIKKKSAK